MYLLSLVIVVALLMAAERCWPARGDTPDRWRNLQAYAAYLTAQLLLLPLVTLAAAAEGYSLIDLGAWPFGPALLTFVIVQDFGEFAFHRAQHRFPWLWRMHALHHSDPHMNVTTTVRHFWGDQLLKAVTIWPLAVLLVKPTPAIVAAYAAIMLIHFFIHSNLRVDLGRWSWVVNGPAYHRRHHSVEAKHYNCNFASILPIFDVLFGSYRRPDGFPKTGLDRRPAGPVDIALWPWRT